MLAKWYLIINKLILTIEDPKLLSKADPALGEKRKFDQVEQDKENDGAKDLNSSSEKRTKTSEDPKADLSVSKSNTTAEVTEAATKPSVANDDDEEVIDTTKKSKNIESEEEKGETPAQFLSKAMEKAVEDAEGDEEGSQEFNMNKDDYDKLKEGDADSEEEVSLDEENEEDLANDDDFDADAYRTFCENEKS